MRIFPALATFAAIAALSAAAAQTYPDGGRTLIDPATGQPRYVPPLLEPWRTQPIHLHPPHKRHSAQHKSSTALASTPDTSSDTYTATSESASPPPVTPRRPKRKHVATAPAAPTSQSAPTSQPEAPPSGVSDFTDLISPQRTAPAAPPPPVRKKPAATPPKPVEQAKPAEPPRISEPPPAEKPVQRASIEPTKPAKTRIAAGNRKDSIIFSANATDPSTTAVSTVRGLAGTLNKALADSSARVQILAYAGMRGEKSSDTRRLSLKRALVIRQLLIDDGVPSERIDVFALGGVDDDGPLDRVDIFVKS